MTYEGFDNFAPLNQDSFALTMEILVGGFMLNKALRWKNAPIGVLGVHVQDFDFALSPSFEVHDTRLI